MCRVTDVDKFSSQDCTLVKGGLLLPAVILDEPLGTLLLGLLINPFCLNNDVGTYVVNLLPLFSHFNLHFGYIISHPEMILKKTNLY